MIALPFYLSLGALALWVGAGLAGETVIGAFSSGALGAWKTEQFSGRTVYRLVTDAGRPVLRADSVGAASGLYRKQPVDLIDTPFLNWSWRVANVLENVDEHSKSGDDYAARVYVIVSGGAWFWRTRTLVYVWSNNQPVDSVWNSPFTANAKMLAVRSGKPETGAWFHEKRAVGEDWQRLFGERIERIDAVAIMTDTDNSGQSATAWYGDIYFSTR
ncbi:MAG: DUF3047 domain-containing protein [Gammaproteobacteria bacterium]|nr:DUF3047 domain-containing protein [Gammaproteobacteria bacterium]MCP5459224.1 DUF3047 domain-containing protein [Gammaproteobacteria bacterium]